MQNKNPKSFDDIAESITPESTHAKILLEERSPRLNRDKVLAVLKKQKIQPVSYELLHSEYPAIILLRIHADNLPELVLKLTENGFTKLKAIHPAGEARTSIGPAPYERG